MEQVTSAVKGISREDGNRLAKLFARFSTAKHDDGKVIMSAGKRKAAAAPPVKSAKK